MLALIAAVPVLVVLVLMVGLGWPAARSGVVAAVLALVLAVVAFDFGGADSAFSVGGGVAGVLAEAAFVSATVVGIIGPALGIHQLQQRTGATDVLRSALGRLTSDPRIAALLIAWFFALFVEGAAGFGTPVALAAPFLVASGFRPLTAVAAALVGHAAGVSFGAVGTPVVAQAAISGFSGDRLAAATAPYHLVAGWLLVSVVVVMIGRGVPEDHPTAGRAPWGWGLLAGATFFVPFGLIAWLIGPELPTLGGAVLGAAVFVLVIRWRRRSVDDPEQSSDDTDPPGDDTTGPARTDRPDLSVVAAAAPYIALIVAVLVTRLIPPLRDLLAEVRVSWELDGGFAGSVQPLYHPALLLTASFAIGAIAQRADRRAVTGAVLTATGQLGVVVVALLAMVTIARTMSHAGMTDELAGAATNVGGAWPLLAPVVGALGTFVTGSATASNILFTELQAETAASGGFEVTTLLGAQGFGAAVGNIVCPHNVVAAAATVGLAGSEGTILRRTFPVAIAYVAIGGLLALWWAS